MKRKLFTTLISLSAAFTSANQSASSNQSGSAATRLPPEWVAAKDWLTVRENPHPVSGRGGGFLLCDFKGRELLRIGNEYTIAYPMVSDKPQGTRMDFTGLIRLGDTQWRADYRCSNARLEKPPVEFYAVITQHGGPRVDVEYFITLPEGEAFGHDQAYRNTLPIVPCEGSALGESFLSPGVWKRADQGVPYEGSGSRFSQYIPPEGHVYLRHAGVGAFQRRPFNTISMYWKRVDPEAAKADEATFREQLKGDVMPATAEHFEQEHGGKTDGAAAQTIAPAGETYSAAMTFYLVPWKDSVWVPAAIQNDQVMAMRVETGRDFNLFDSSREQPSFELVAMNPRNETRNVRLTVTARNYDGRVEVDEMKNLSFKPFEMRRLKFALPKGRSREFWFVEAAFSDAAGNGSFVRSHVATIPPHQYRHLDTSVMGIAAYFPIPGHEQVRRLMRRMGVRWMRSASDMNSFRFADYGMVGIKAFHLPKECDGPENEGKRRDFAREQLVYAKTNSCAIVELGNELNFGVKADVKKERIANYIPWLKAFHDVRAELGLADKVDISTFGLAGADNEFLGLLAQADGWQYLDVISLHPGRLNQTPDNPGPDWQWNYRSQIQTTKNAIRQHRKDRKIKLILTEVYARTPPNMNDSDSLRTAAENVTLSCALAKIEGATALNWYQMHDSVHSNIGGVNEHNKEYHYGLLWRDGTVKPMLLAFCAISEALDGAEFQQEVSFADKRKAWCFITPRGPMAVLYDRRDGYYPYPGMFTGKPFEGHLDPWLDHWKSHTEYEFRSRAKEVTVVDTIGRHRKIPVRDGKVALTLSGTPLIVYGLEL